MKRDRLIAQIRALAERAVHPRTPEHERNTSAVIACEKMLALFEAGAFAEDAPPKPQRRPVKLPFAVLLVGEFIDSFRFARVDGSTRQKGTRDYLTIPKRAIVDVQWLSESEKISRFGPFGGRVSEHVLVTAEWADTAKAG